jgi:hypothetical protein
MLALKKLLLRTAHKPQPETKSEEKEDVYTGVLRSLNDHETTLEQMVCAPKGASLWPGVATALQVLENARNLLPRVGKHYKGVLAAHLLKDVQIQQAARVGLTQSQLHHARQMQHDDHDLFQMQYTPHSSKTSIEDNEITATIEIAVTHFFHRRSSGPEDACLRVDTKGRVYWDYYRGIFHDGKVASTKLTAHNL